MTLYISKFNAVVIHVGTLFVLSTRSFNLYKYGLILICITATLARIEEVVIHYRYEKIPESRDRACR